MFRTGLSDALYMAPMYFPSSSRHGLAMASATQAPSATRDAAQSYHQHDQPDQHDQHVRSLPDALRCGYTSKRCENPRTVKKSGGLHRFCAYHRERANKNQWRVDNRRRLLRRMGQSTKSTASDCGSPRSTTSDTMEDVTPADLCGAEDTDAVKAEGGAGGFTDLLDPAGSPNTLSEQDAKILNAMLFSDEDEPIKSDISPTTQDEEPLAHKDMMLDFTMTTMPAFVPPQEQEPSTCALTVSTDASWSCACSQCLAWPTMFFYHDALSTVRKSRVDPYARV